MNSSNESYGNKGPNGFFFVWIIVWVSFLIWALNRYDFFQGILAGVFVGPFVSSMIVLVIDFIFGVVSKLFKD